MRAAVLEQFGSPLVVKEVEIPSIGPHEVLVRVRNCGVCGTDLKIKAGRWGPAPLPMIMGHEAAGEVVEVGPEVLDFRSGDPVVVNFYVTCGRCRHCRQGRDTLCQESRQHGFNIDGGFAEYMKTRAANLCKVPDQLPLEQACTLACAVSTAYHAVTGRANIQPGTAVAIVGVGGVGLHTLQMARLAGAWTVAVDVNEERLALAKKLGADAVVIAGEPGFHEELRRLTDGEGVDVVIEFVASRETLDSSYRSLRRGGRLVLVGYDPNQPMTLWPHEAVRGELEVVGSRAASTRELAETLDLVVQGRVLPIVDQLLPLEEVERAYELLSQGKVLGRAVLTI